MTIYCICVGRSALNAVTQCTLVALQCITVCSTVTMCCIRLKCRLECIECGDTVWVERGKHVAGIGAGGVGGGGGGGGGRGKHVAENWGATKGLDALCTL